MFGALTRITLLVDWDSTRRFPWIDDPFTRCRLRAASSETQLDEVFRMVAQSLKSAGFSTGMVAPRIYHGWHSGTTATKDYRNLLGRSANQTKFGHFAFLPPVLAETLACGGPKSLLRDTLRTRPEGGIEQKMVDSAIAADLLFEARSSTTSRNQAFVVLGEDDDLLPPVVVADAWRVHARVLRTRPPNPHMPLMAGLLLAPS